MGFLVLGLVLLLAAAVVVAVGFGAISIPNYVVRRRVHTMVETPSQEPTRAMFPTTEQATSFLSQLTPLGLMTRIEHNMVLAGRPDGWTRDRVVVAKPLGAVVGLLFALVVFSSSPGFWAFLFLVAATALGYFLPDLLIYNQAIKRQERIQRDLPDTLDQIVISIEAGVGFESALSRAGENGEGPLADEFVRLIQDIQVGMSRREAYLALAERTSVEELQNFAKAIVQAEEYGVSVANVVRTQASEMRHGRRLRAETRAQKVPVKILIPLMLCILPVLFVVVLGPAIVSAYSNT